MRMSAFETMMMAKKSEKIKTFVEEGLEGITEAVVSEFEEFKISKGKTTRLLQFSEVDKKKEIDSLYSPKMNFLTICQQIWAGSLTLTHRPFTI